jgi:hypothetical protein
MKQKNEREIGSSERISEKNITILKRLRGCTEFTNKEEMLKDIEKKRNEKRYG